MRSLILLLLIFGFIFGAEHQDRIELSEEGMKDLGIRIKEIRKEPAVRVLRMPAEVEENPLLSFRIFSPVEGIVRKLYVKEGDFVRKGDILAEIYSPELADLIGEVEMAKVRMENARKLFERDKELYSQRVIQYTRYYNSMINYERAKGEYEALRNRLRSYGEVRGYHLLLRSPGTGYIVSQDVVLGDSVGLDNVLFEIHSHDVLWVYGWADEGSVREIREGMRGKVITDYGVLPCRVDFVGHEVDRKTRRVKIRCVTRNREHLLRPGMFVKLEIRIGKGKAILIPKEAVQDVEGKRTVFVWEGGYFEPREIRILRELDGYYVVEGLKEGERIAVSGTIFLKTKLVGVEEGGHAH